MTDRLVPGVSRVRVTAKTKAGFNVEPDEKLEERGYWRERDLGNGRSICEWVSEPDEAKSDKAVALRYGGTRAHDFDDFLPRKPKRDWLADDRSWRLPTRTSPSRRDWLSTAVSTLEEPELGSWDNPRPLNDGLVLFGRMMPFGELTEIKSATEGHFLEAFAPGALAKTLRERGARVRLLLEHGHGLLGNQPLAALESMHERTDGAIYRSRLFPSVPKLLLDGLRAGVYGSSIRFRPLSFVRDTRPRPSSTNPDGLEERTVREAELIELSVVTFPAYQGATAQLADS
jgi:HK97 family phage prohead protease